MAAMIATCTPIHPRLFAARFNRAITVFAATTLLGGPCLADLAKDKTDCSTMSLEAAARADACARVLATPALTPEEISEAVFRHGIASFNQGKLDEALADFDKALAINPAGADYHAWRAAVFRAKRDFRQAIASYDNAIALKPELARPYFLRGECYFRLEDFARAIADFDRALQLKPDDPESLYSRGQANLQINQFDRAVADFDRHILASPFHAASYASRGYGYDKLGDKARAIRDFRIAVLLDPNWDVAEEGIKRLAPISPLAAPDAPITFQSPPAQTRFIYIQIETKAQPEKSDIEAAMGDLIGWFNRPPLPVARRGTRFELVVGGIDGFNQFATTTRTAAFPPVTTPTEQKLAMYRSLWPHVWPGPLNQRMVIAYDNLALDGLWPLKLGQRAGGAAEIYLPKCPPGADPAASALACPPDQRMPLGTIAWKTELVRWEQVVVPAGAFDAMVIRQQEDTELTMMGRTMKRSSVAHFWYAPSLKWWVRRTTEADGQIMIVELVETK